MTLPTSYINIAELRDSPYNILPDEADDTYLDILIGLTQAMIDKFCKRSLLQVGDTGSEVEIKINGSGNDTIFLSNRIITLDSIKIYYTSDSYTEYDASNFNVKPLYIQWNAFAPGDQTVRLAFMTDMFPKGNANIGVVGIWGFAESSGERKAAKYLQGKMIRKMIDTPSFTEQFKNYSAGDFNGTINIDDSAGQITGDFQLDLIIRNLRKTLTYAIS